MGKKFQKKKNIRKQWDPAKMASAVDAVTKGEMGYLKASKLYGVPQTTLERLAKKRNIAPELAVQIPLGRRLYCHKISRMISNSALYSWNSAVLGSQPYKFVNLPSKFHITLTKMRNVLVKIG
jgi:hypothetical protein